MVQTLDPANRRLRLIPLLKVECKKPLRVGALTHIDLTDGADQELAWRQLLTALGKPPEPEPPQEPHRGEWFLAHPYPMPPNFTGRVAERTMLNRWLEADAAHPLLVICAGRLRQSCAGLALADERCQSRAVAARCLVELLRGGRKFR